MSSMPEWLRKTVSVAKALATGKDIGEERMRKRLEICAACEKMVLRGDIMRCGICGCKVMDNGLINLARYEETKDYGCKWTNEDGYTDSKWKRAGV